MKEKFTQGKWEISNRPPFMVGVEGADDFICDGVGIHDAHLIVAAPEMYWALSAILNGERLPAGQTIESILAKARGE